MIDIDKLSEAQVRYILRELYDVMSMSLGDVTTDYYLQLIAAQNDYPQDNNEGDK